MSLDMMVDVVNVNASCEKRRPRVARSLAGNAVGSRRYRRKRERERERERVARVRVCVRCLLVRVVSRGLLGLF